MGRCLISFGANMGDARQTIRDGVVCLQEALGCEANALRLSRHFRTPPVGGPTGQPPFVNAVAAVETNRSVWEVWDAVRHVEHQFGRRRNRRWEARSIDLDILLYDDARIWTPHLKVPHPRMCMRRFILVPARDVAPDWIEPVCGWRIDQLAENLEARPASLSLVAEDQSLATSFLEEAARLAVARWQFPAIAKTEANWEQERGLGGVEQRRDRQAEATFSRWVSLITPEQIPGIKLLDQANLLVFLAPPISGDGIAWEDFHRKLAIDLRLLSVQEDRPVLASAEAPGAILDQRNDLPRRDNALIGPRYLLASDDPQWAVHELVSALEAMDCPVEPLS